MRIMLAAPLVALVAAAAVAPPAARSAGETSTALTIDSTVLNLGAGTMSGVIHVQNHKDAPDNVEVRAYAWEQHDGRDAFSPTPDLIAGPMIFTLGPNGRQTVRVGLRNAAAATRERAYRVVVSEIPPDRRLGQGIAMDLAFSFPVFVAPQRPTVTESWSFARVDDRHARVTLSNTGTMHVKFNKLSLADASGGLVGTFEPGPTTVLAGESASWIVPLSHPIAPGSQVALTASGDSGTMTATLR